MASPQRTALITGCSKGSAGEAHALEWASRGLRVFATARSLKSIQHLEEKGIEVLTLDVTSTESIAALREEITKRTGGKLDILFNNAGVMYEAPAIEEDDKAVRQMYNANVFGLFDMVKAFTPLLMVAKPDPSQPPTIINVASILAVMPYIFSASYNASKAAVASYSDTLRVELAPLGIKVVTLYMGIVGTGLFKMDAMNLPADSLYFDFVPAWRKRGEDHAKSGMKPADFAKGVADAVLKGSALGRGEYMWKGAKSTLVWALHAFGWRKIFDSTTESEMGWNDAKLKRSLAEKKEQAVAKKG
ncbi:putative short-chain dehydrogenases/reductase [Bimuria novae-zelandiae CBS 107.79]|uniref:Putative short-chain dehydrogenases/reductase n=1 Tax=Bimuria novae-zelandiae CBS 107.79 TaxID=1447943 RepID=A0A6A5V984_9PLEO|nr:putative short-chain dehydrogenases/reductase [Bimuria novae-zelandiae CBS 107.79]